MSGVTTEMIVAEKYLMMTCSLNSGQEKESLMQGST